jgi:glucose/arabinose dehydrogenase
VKHSFIMSNQQPLSLRLLTVLLLAGGTVAHIAAQECKGFAPRNGAPVIAKGYTANVVINKLTKPRGLIVDTEGNLLIVERGKGITAIKLNDQGVDCVSPGQKITVVSSTALNHGIELSADGKKLYASDSSNVYSWDYDAKQAKTTSPKATIITGMFNTGHSSRTLMMSKKLPGTLLVSRGSEGNIDSKARDIKTGHSQIRAFDVSQAKGSVDFSTSGKLIGWGLRNSVGIGENPTDGGIWSNENGSDNLRRDGKDIHENSPGEEVNYHGTLVNNKFAGQGKNYGYPECAATWTPAAMPRNANLRVGTQFLLNSETQTMNDTVCRNKFIAPRITLPSHWAPIDIKFNSQGTVAYMTSRGSW